MEAIKEQNMTGQTAANRDQGIATDEGPRTEGAVRFERIGIVGLGYVGLPLSLQFARSGVQVCGLDVDADKVEAINSGRSYIKHIESAMIEQERSAGRLMASANFAEIRRLGAVIICVPTPLNKNRE